MRSRVRPAVHVALVLALAACAPAPEPVPAAPAAASTAPMPSLSARDHERVRAAVARGDYVPLADIVEDALRRHPGRVLEVELENDEYEIEILGADGRLLEFEYDARTGELKEIEVEEDGPDGGPR